jgi:hypothetical protein
MHPSARTPAPSREPASPAGAGAGRSGPCLAGQLDELLTLDEEIARRAGS